MRLADRRENQGSPRHAVDEPRTGVSLERAAHGVETGAMVPRHHYQDKAGEHHRNRIVAAGGKRPTSQRDAVSASSALAEAHPRVFRCS
jgi:hypothetical protein